MECKDSEVVSSFFTFQANATRETKLELDDISDDFLCLIDQLNTALEDLKLPMKVDCVYNSTIYARHTFEMYIKQYCNTKKDIMYFGMNPGPWGMSQTGVPFGEIKSVRDWLGIEGPVGKPPKEIKTRPIKGFKCTRTEISGKRFWGLFKNLCETPDKFFQTSFVYNYFPQQWMKSNGCNLTPGDFKSSEMQQLYDICDPVFIKVLKLYEVKIVVAVGKFCETRAQRAIKKYLSSHNIKVLYLPHPSPRTVNNNNWEQRVIEEMRRLDLLQYYKENIFSNT